MKARTQESLHIWCLILALLFVGSMLAVGNFKAKTFICKDNIIAEELTPMDLREMFDDCLDKCSRDNLDCIKPCIVLVVESVRN